MTTQTSIPPGALEWVQEYRGFQVWIAPDGRYEAYRAKHPLVVGYRKNKHTGAQEEVTKPQKSDRVVLPGTSLEEALAGLDRYLAKKPKAPPEVLPPTLF